MKLIFDITATLYLICVYFATGAVGVFAAIAINAIGAVRSVIFLLRDKNKFFDSYGWLVFFEIIQGLSLIISYTSPLSIVPTIASMFTTFGLFLNKQKITKCLIIVAQSMFIVYYSILLKDSDLLTGLMLISCITIFSSAVIGLSLILIKEKREKKSLLNQDI